MKTLFIAALILCAAFLHAAEESNRKPWTLGPGDVIRLQIWNHETDATLTVTPEGTIVAPLIGKVPVEGLTIKEAEELLAKRYSAGFLKDPQVIITIEKYFSHRVSVFGAATETGEFPIIGPMTLADLYNKVRGHRPDSDGRIIVRRKGATGPEGVIVVPIPSLLAGDARADLELQDGDRIFFPSQTMQYVEVFGAVKKPGRYALYPGMTIIHAISAAGGLAEGASNRIRLFRRAEAEATPPPEIAKGEGKSSESSTVRIFEFDKIVAEKEKTADIALANGDYIIVESAETVTPGLWILGAVHKPGWYPWPKGKELTVRKALTLAEGALPIASFWRIKIDREINGEVRRMRADLDTLVQPGDTILVPESWI